MVKYTEEQKTAVLSRIPEIGISEAAKEAGIPVSTVSKWAKAEKPAEAQALFSKVEEAAAKEVNESAIDAYTEMMEAEEEAVAIIDQAREKDDAAIKKEIKENADAVKIETKKKTATVTRQVKEKKEKEETVKEASKETAEEVAEVVAEKAAEEVAEETAKVAVIFETNYGRQITSESILERIPKGVDAAYIKLEENKIYWVKGTETGSVDIW